MKTGTDDEDLWIQGYATPPTRGNEDAEEALPDMDDASSPTSQNDDSPFEATTPRRGLNFEKHRSYLKLREMPGTPRTLLQQRRPNDQAPFHMPKPGRFNTSTPLEFGAPTEGGLAVRKTNVNPFTPMAARAKRPASPVEDNHHTINSAADEDDDEAILSRRSMRTRSNSIFGSPIKLKMPRNEPSRDPNNRSNISRYAEEFEQVCQIGAGEFGTVMKCKFRIDGTMYAIKRSKKPISGLAEEQQLLREVYAHAVINTQPHIVRYYSAWTEDNHMLIQNEYCDGGSLADELKRRKGKSFEEPELIVIFKHVALGLRCLHAKKLVHLDIKPGNIFIKTEEVAALSDGPFADNDDGDGTDDDDDDDSVFAVPMPKSMLPKRDDMSDAMETNTPSRSLIERMGSGARSKMDLLRSITTVPEEGPSTMNTMNTTTNATSSNDSSIPTTSNAVPTISITTTATPSSSTASSPTKALRKVYKIGDLGLVTQIDEPNVGEGDCRYMPKELLNENYGELPKADIFALGISVYELASGKELPKNGEYWHTLRDGKAPHIPHCSADLNHLIELCLHPNPTTRPNANDILKHPALVKNLRLPIEKKSKDQLARELGAAKMQTSQLLRQLEEEKKSRDLLGAINAPITRRNSAPVPRRKRTNSLQW